MPRRASPRFAPGWVAGAVAAFLCLHAGAAFADEPEPSSASTNPNVYPPSSAQPNLILIGAGVTAGWYGAAFGLSYLWPNSPGASSMRIPVAGPYMSLFKTGCGSAEVGCGTFTLVLRTILTGLTAVGQTGGVLAIIEGTLLPTTSPGERPSPRRSSATLRISPEAPAPLIDPMQGISPVGTPASTRAAFAAPLGLTLSGNF